MRRLVGWQSYRYCRLNPSRIQSSDTEAGKYAARTHHAPQQFSGTFAMYQSAHARRVYTEISNIREVNMRIETTLRASFQLQNLDGELKEWVKECLVRLEAGKSLAAEPFPSEPHTFFTRFKEYVLVFKRKQDTVEIQDLLNLRLVPPC
jgi:hypothetical protein